jgi:hypothetical protein
MAEPKKIENAGFKPLKLRFLDASHIKVLKSEKGEPINAGKFNDAFRAAVKEMGRINEEGLPENPKEKEAVSQLIDDILTNVERHSKHENLVVKMSALNALQLMNVYKKNIK